MKIAIVGAGAAGLIAAKLLKDKGIAYDVFESNNQVGGTWIYSENITDKYGRPVTSSMYKNLRTNLPKEVMMFSGFNYDIEGKSFIKASAVLDYLEKFAKKYDLRSHIKFEHVVSKISRKGEKWELVAKELKIGNYFTENYDAVFVCNGHYSTPTYPKIKGSTTFKGLVLHSHHYKIPDTFKNKTALIIGIGPSGQDIAFDLAPQSKLIYLSHHGPEYLKQQFPENVIHKPDITEIKGNNIHFNDGTVNEVDAILYCTGYCYNFPFLDESCGIFVEDNYVTPLYKQMISIPHPSMFFIGLPFRSFIFPMLELQIRCCLNVMAGKANLPTKERMQEDTLAKEEILKCRGYPKNKYHMIAEYVREYFSDIANNTNTKPCPDILFAIFEKSTICRREDLNGYRAHTFEIIDQNNFIYR